VCCLFGVGCFWVLCVWGGGGGGGGGGWAGTSVHKFGHHFMGTSPITGEILPVFIKRMQQAIT
jgi:hypothetical protein